MKYEYRTSFVKNDSYEIEDALQKQAKLDWTFHSSIVKSGPPGMIYSNEYVTLIFMKPLAERSGG